MINVESEIGLLNIGVKELIRHAIKDGEGELSSSGVFTTSTGKRTGRSPKDRFIVQDNLTATTVDWGDINRPITQRIFSTLWSRAFEQIQNKKHYVSDLQVGQESQYALPVKVITELAWHNAFCCHMFVELDAAVAGNKQEWTILNSVSTTLNGKRRWRQQ